mmetsp:Transcript_39494/g.95534  ORF Transcript_39494/g.95534 Transcript_39494/m.95534 type:complete len:410 (-) Transcript_39494:133-1362(-)
MGLEDLYDRNEGGAGIGGWSLLALDVGFADGYPPAMDPFSKERLGWGTFKQLSESRNSIVLKPSYTSHQYYKITKGFPDGEYLLIENRQKIGFDSKIPGTGLLIWHIDTAKAKKATNSDDGPPFNDDEGHPGQSGWPQNNKHYMVAVLAADGEYKFEKGTDSEGDASDLYGKCMGGGSIGPTTSHPNTNTYQGGTVKATGIKIKNIYQDKQNNMVFDICFGDCAAGSQEPSIECCVSDDSWKDTDGNGCNDYKTGDCAKADEWANDAGVSAKTACCLCKENFFFGNGDLPDTPNVEIFPGSPVGGSPTSTVTSTCVDNPTWKDSAGDGCDKHQDDWCGVSANEYANHGITANTACCVCKASCVNDATWKDSDGDGCEDYSSGEACGDEALQYANAAGINANMACCVCKK